MRFSKSTRATLSVLMFVQLCLLSFATAQFKVKEYKVRREDSQVGFTIYKWMVIKEEGRFKDFDGSIMFDPGNPSATSVEFHIKAGSIDSRNSDRDDVLRSKEYFDVAKHQMLSFKSVSAEEKDKSHLLVTGDLTIKGKTKRIVVPVTLLGINAVGGDLGELAGFESIFTINRLDFGVGDSGPLLGKEVSIHLMIGASTKG